MSKGRIAYDAFCRIRAEEGRQSPDWDRVGHTDRMAWEAAAMAIVDDVFPTDTEKRRRDRESAELVRQNKGGDS